MNNKELKDAKKKAIEYSKKCMLNDGVDEYDMKEYLVGLGWTDENADEIVEKAEKSIRRMLNIPHIWTIIGGIALILFSLLLTWITYNPYSGGYKVYFGLMIIGFILIIKGCMSYNSGE